MNSIRPWMAFAFGALVYPAALLAIEILTSWLGLQCDSAVEGFIVGLIAAVPLTLLSAVEIKLWNEGNISLARVIGAVVGAAGIIALLTTIIKDRCLVPDLLLALCWCDTLLLVAVFSKKWGWSR